MTQERIDKFVRSAMIAVMAAEDANFAVFTNTPEVYRRLVKQTAEAGIRVAEQIGFEELGEEE